MKNSNNFLLVFSIRSVDEAKFYLSCARYLNKKFKIEFISFNEFAHHFIKKKFSCYNIFDYSDKQIIKNINLDLEHEAREFSIRKKNTLKYKADFYNSSLTKYFLKKKSIFKKILVIQEIGGFISHQAVYNIAQKFKIDHLALEPSFFKDRYMILKNSYLIPNYETKNCVNKNYFTKKIDSLVRQKPYSFLDLHKKRYRSSFLKIIDPDNFKKLYFKLVRKYFYNLKEDYNYIFRYVKKFILMGLSNLFLYLIYKKKIRKKYIYFPLHVPNDISLTLRAKKYIDQLNLVEKIAKIFLEKKDYVVVIKEHPSFVGNYNFFSLLKLAFKKNILLVNPFINNFDLIKNSELLITINSKSGMEAILLNKKLASLANSTYFYSKCNIKLKKINKKSIFKILKKKITYTIKDSKNLLYSHYLFSHSGEMYNNKKSNIIKFSNSLFEYIKKN